MKLIPVVILVLLLSAARSKSQDVQEKPLLITVYYESKSDDCQRFIKDVLYTAWAAFYKNVSFELIPFGIAQQSFVDGDWEFHCQNGPEECQSNKVHACVIYEACGKPSMEGCADNKNGRIFDFINCYSSSSSIECAKEVDLNENAINSCLTGTKGTELLNHYGNLTSAFPYKILGVPTITFDGVPQNDVQYDLGSKICLTRPTLCKSSDTSSIDS